MFVSVPGVSDFVIITGLSGAGRSSAADAFEDLGWFVIDNLPPALITKMADLVSRPGSETSKVVLAIGTGAFFDEFAQAIDDLRVIADSVRIVFLDAADDVLVRRFEGTRRRHPLDESGLSEAVVRERQLLTSIKAMADVVIDTSDLNVHQLRDRIVELFASADSSGAMRTAVMSFGYKHGLPLDVDLVLDCRFLPNPHWDPALRPLTGLDEPVRDYVMNQPETAEFLQRLDGLLELTLPAYVKEGKSYLTIAVGCTGGRHRSVAIAEAIAKNMTAHGFSPSVSHRDIDK
jgi:UPF0042 nucleotide-binding protein